MSLDHCGQQSVFVCIEQIVSLCESRFINAVPLAVPENIIEPFANRIQEVHLGLLPISESYIQVLPFAFEAL